MTWIGIFGEWIKNNCVTETAIWLLVKLKPWILGGCPPWVSLLLESRETIWDAVTTTFPIPIPPDRFLLWWVLLWQVSSHGVFLLMQNFSTVLWCPSMGPSKLISGGWGGQRPWWFPLCLWFSNNQSKCPSSIPYPVFWCGNTCCSPQNYTAIFWTNFPGHRP